MQFYASNIKSNAIFFFYFVGNFGTFQIYSTSIGKYHMALSMRAFYSKGLTHTTQNVSEQCKNLPRN